jgi:ABC-2 type transport system permease protein
MKRIVIAVLRAEWRAMLRNRVALTAGLLLLMLTVAATLVGFERMRSVAAERARFQHTADAQWDAQPDRHPHRVVHYGHYVFRTTSPLSLFDFGVDPFTGHTLFLEGHRQNSANFSDAGQSSVLLRFGQLTPAFVLQVITPLLIAFLAFGSIAREREQGQLRLLVAQGASGMALLGGKLLAHAGVALLMGLPVFVALAALSIANTQVRMQGALMVAGYAAYLLLWSTLAVLISASLPRARDALLVLVGCWIASTVVLPRLMPDVAAHQVERPTRIEAEAAVALQLAAMGDSHNPNDPHFAQFRARILKQYGVASVEQLPVNYGGLVIAEGERLTSALFEQAMLAEFARQERQNRLVDRAALLSPVLALRRLSMALAGTDGASHVRFLLAAERYRYALIQALNQLHTTEVRYHNDRDQRLDSAHWKRMPRFVDPLPTTAQSLAQGGGPAAAVLGGWLILLAGGALLVARRLERSAV